MTVGFKTVYNGRSTEIDDLLLKREFFSDGGLWTWGRNNGGELGDGSTTNRSSPGTTAGSGINWISVAISSRGSAGIKSDGTLWTWGSNAGGVLGDSTAGNFSRSSPGTTAGGGSNWKQISLGKDSTSFFAGAVKTDGTLWTWGANDWGQLGDGTLTFRSSPGTTAGGGSNWKQISCGYRFMAAVKTDGTLWTWGINISGKLGDGTTTSKRSPITTAGGGTTWKEVSCGYDHVTAIKTDGTLWTWGGNTFGKLGTGDTTSRSSPGTTAGGGTNWKTVSSYYSESAAIKTDGTLWTWGYNFSGELGDGTTTSRSSPGTTAGGGTNWKSLGQGYDNNNWMGAIKADGTLWTWGYGATGRLGTGDTTNRSSPGTLAGGGTNWKMIGIGQEHGIAITDLTI